MAYQLDCPSCGKSVTGSAELVGRMVACPHCSKHFSLPEEGVPPLPPVKTETAVEAAQIRFTFACQRCSSILEASSRMSGQPGRCPSCGAVFIVPAVDHNTGLASGPALVADDGQLPTPVHAYAAAGDKAPKILRISDELSVIVCPRCNTHMPVDANVCTSCGIPFTIEGASSIMKSDHGGNGLATAAVILGIASVFMFKFAIFGAVAIGLGIGGLQRARKMGKPHPGRVAAWVGIFCGGASSAIFLAWQLLP